MDKIGDTISALLILLILKTVALKGKFLVPRTFPLT